jgi:hypothetical protein
VKQLFITLKPVDLTTSLSSSPARQRGDPTYFSAGPMVKCADAGALHTGETCGMSPASADLRTTTGYLVADRTGHLVGKVECAMYGTAPDDPDALSVRSRAFPRHRLLVPAASIAEIDAASGVVGLTVDRDAVRRFL